MKGNCLCGAVSITAPDTTRVSACHCEMCRRWGGGPLLAVHCDASVEIEGHNNISCFSSSDWAERAFCSSCGTHLYYRIKGSDGYILFAGFFGGQIAFEFAEQIFTDSKPHYYEFANETENLTGEEVFAKYAPAS